MASRGQTTQLHNMYVADFETCDAWEDDGITYPDQRVWLAGVMDLEKEHMVYFNNLDDFMEEVLSRKDNCNREYAFHNLKFDGSYIIPWLLNNGWTSTTDRPEKGQFSALIDERNAWYSITIQVTSKRRVLLWDSLKLFPSALEYLPDQYGTPTRKIKENEDFYERRREEGHEPTKEELAYLWNDLKVLSETLREHINIYGLRFKKTQASQSFYNFEKHFPAWKLRFPPLEVEEDKDIRSAYWGGVSHVNAKHQGKDCYNVAAYDINSSYPYQLAEKQLPYGPAIQEWGEGKAPDMSKFWVAEALVEFKLKPGKTPCIPTKGVTEGRPITNDKWLSDSEGIVRLIFCRVDYMTIFDSYDFEVVRWVWSVHWAWKRQKEIKKFIIHNNDIKVKYKRLAKTEKDPELSRQHMIKSKRAKIDNNGFYGKFGEEIEKRGKTPHKEGRNVVYRVDRFDTQSKGKRKFLPMAIAVTAWGRKQLIEMANLLGDHFIYCDTDSVHYFKEGGDQVIERAKREGIIKVDSTELGAWDHEGDFPFGRYLRAKCYMEGDPRTGKFEVTLAGLPADKGTGQGSKVRSCITFDNFHVGHVIPGGNGKLRTVRTPTGSKLVPTDFEIKEVESLF